LIQVSANTTRTYTCNVQRARSSASDLFTHQSIRIIVRLRVFPSQSIPLSHSIISSSPSLIFTPSLPHSLLCFSLMPPSPLSLSLSLSLSLPNHVDMSQSVPSSSLCFINITLSVVHFCLWFTVNCVGLRFDELIHFPRYFVCISVFFCKFACCLFCLFCLLCHLLELSLYEKPNILC
jgi:hypothetical protein